MNRLTLILEAEEDCKNIEPLANALRSLGFKVLYMDEVYQHRLGWSYRKVEFERVSKHTPMFQPP
jgi:hypothetical protein